MFPSPQESPFYYLSRVWVTRILTSKKKILKNLFFFWNQTLVLATQVFKNKNLERIKNLWLKKKHLKLKFFFLWLQTLFSWLLKIKILKEKRISGLKKSPAENN